MEERKKQLEIVGIGACVMDTLITVPSFPEEDTKLRALESRAAGGGPVATAVAAAAHLGIAAGFLGVLAGDGGGNFLYEDFRKYGVDVGHIRRLEGYRSFTSSIWLARDRASRTCVFDKGTLPPYTLDEGGKEAVAEAKILLIDGNELEAALEACAAARENGTEVLYDCGGRYEGVEKLLELTDIMIPSEEFALSVTGCQAAEEAAESLHQKYHPRLTVVTCGREGGILYDGSSLRRYPAFPVEAVDTNGAGDVFHGAFGAAWIRGCTPYACCIFASAVSAIKCMGVGARESVPDWGTAEDFLAQRGYTLEKR